MIRYGRPGRITYTEEVAGSSPVPPTFLHLTGIRLMVRVSVGGILAPIVTCDIIIYNEPIIAFGQITVLFSTVGCHADRLRR